MKYISEMDCAEREEVLDLLCHSLDRQADHARLCSDVNMHTLLSTASETLRTIASEVASDRGTLAESVVEQAVRMLAKAQMELGPIISATVH